jgi:cytochrome c oxidase subunit 2
MRQRLWAYKGWLALLGVVLLALAAVALGSHLPFPSGESKARSFTVEASRFAYSPERIRVNKGDSVTIRLVSRDVGHGLYLDGYDLETVAHPDQEGVLEFIADKPGVFRFRCNLTCGPLHPFMIGQLEVAPNTPFISSSVAVVAVAVGALGIGGWMVGRNGGGRRQEPGS